MNGASSTITRSVEDEWVQCERELHATAMPDVQRYQSDLRALRAQTDQLQDLATLDQLVQAWSADQDGGGDRRARLVRGAAFAQRARQIQSAADARAIEARIAQARVASEAWVVLQETGNPREEGAAFSLTIMHLVSGLATVSMAQPAIMAAGFVYSLAVIRLDANSGALVDGAPGLEDWLEVEGRAELNAAAERWRRKIETGVIELDPVM